MPALHPLKSAGITIIVIVLTVLVLAFGIGAYNTMPDYAGVYLAHTSKTYVPLPCLREWKKTPGYDDAELSNAGEARRLHYRIAEGCQRYMMGVEQTIGSSFLRDKGILSPTTEWWDQPYRTDAGTVYPKRQ